MYTPEKGGGGKRAETVKTVKLVLLGRERLWSGMQTLSRRKSSYCAESAKAESVDVDICRC